MPPNSHGILQFLSRACSKPIQRNRKGGNSDFAHWLLGIESFNFILIRLRARALRTLRRMLSLACHWEIIDRKPRIKLRKEVERTAVFDADMGERFLKVARQPLREVFLISHGSGLRPEEVIRMRWENVLWEKNLI